MYVARTGGSWPLLAHQSTCARTMPSDQTSPNTGARTCKECRCLTAAAVDILFCRYASSSMLCTGFLSSQKLDANWKPGVPGKCTHGVLWHANDSSPLPGEPASLLRLSCLKADSAARDNFRMAFSGTKTAQSGMTLFAFRILSDCVRTRECGRGWGRAIGHFALIGFIYQRVMKA